MKRFFITIFAFYYLAVASGVTVHHHYCMGKLASMDLFQPRKNPCPCGEKGEMPGCCTHEVHLLKTDCAQQTAITALPMVQESWIPDVPEATSFLFSNKGDLSPSLVFRLPDRSCTDLPFFLLFHNLRI